MIPKMITLTLYMFLMRDEKEERKKQAMQGQTNKQVKATQHMRMAPVVDMAMGDASYGDNSWSAGSVPLIIAWSRLDCDH